MAKESTREERVSAARKKTAKAVDRERTRAAFKAAGAEPDEDAVEAAAALAEERLANIAARAAEVSESRNESEVSAESVAVAARAQ